MAAVMNRILRYPHDIVVCFGHATFDAKYQSLHKAAGSMLQWTHKCAASYDKERPECIMTIIAAPAGTLNALQIYHHQQKGVQVPLSL